MITNTQYDEIKRIYDRRRRIAEDKKEERMKYVSEKIPAIDDINEQLRSNSTKALTLSLMEGNNDALDNLKKSNEGYIEKVEKSRFSCYLI